MQQIITARNHYFDPESHIIISVNFSGNPSASEIKNAINKTVESHEIFSTKIEQDANGNAFFVPCPNSSIKIEETVIKENDIGEFSDKQKRMPFDFQNGEYIRFYINKLVNQNSLVIVVNHLIGDGLAIVFLVRDILTSMNYPDEKPDERPFQLIDNIGFPKNTEISLIEKIIRNTLNKKWKKEKKIFSYIEYLEMFHLFWNMRHIELKTAVLSNAELKGLILKCKQKDISINSVLSAAFKYSFGKGRFGMPVSVRPKDYEGMGNYVSGITVEYNWDEELDFWVNAQKIHDLIYKKLLNEKKKYHVLQFLRGVEPTLIDAVSFEIYSGFSSKISKKTSQLFKFTEDKRNAFGVTNLSKPRVQTRKGNYSIESMLFLPPIISATDSVIGIVTINDCLSLTMQYPEKDQFKNYGKLFDETIQTLKTLAI